MVQTWSSWKRFPDVESGDNVEAPIGPGVYEVRHMSTGQVIAFGPAGNVAQALSELKVNGGAGTFARLFRRQPLVSRVSDRVLAMNMGEALASGTPSEVQSDARVIEAYLGTVDDVSSLRRVA